MGVLEEKLNFFAENAGMNLNEDMLRSFRAYYELLEERNKVMNLTAISGEADVAVLHFADSLALLGIADLRGKSVIDIGSGAGFPGIPLKIACPDMDLTLLDAQRKRVDFMTEAAKAVGAEVEAIHGRAEEYGADPGYRERYDFAVSRAVAGLNILAELCLPFVKVGGAMLAMKSTDSDEEIAEARNAIKKHGCTVEKIDDYPLFGTEITRRCVIIRKESPTPKAYPRRFAKIQKEPL
ncbi:MAG: 16S rRNA (guanine(527)-N(7))-methyltransferase RsmG [Oscillospiraceae bacterium]|nr:16S rRNA (guanine(527)-N(7))-methyltransferase RsmG [Oscillospiraceae bacterium]